MLPGGKATVASITDDGGRTWAVTWCDAFIGHIVFVPYQGWGAMMPAGNTVQWAGESKGVSPFRNCAIMLEQLHRQYTRDCQAFR